MSEWLTLFREGLPSLLAGAWITLEITAVGLVMGFVLGLLSGLGRVYGSRPLRWLSIAYIELFRGTPLLVQLFLIYYGLPGLGITFSRLDAAFLAMGLNSGAYQAEYLRGSLLAVGQGQMLAGRAIGLSRWQTIWYIILPQALRLAIPAWANEPVALLKSSAVAFLVAVPELMARAKSIAAQTYDPIGAYLAAGVIYLAIVFALDRLLKAVEQRTRIPGLEITGKRA
jgi:polar amino acid transport system permease protein